MGSERPFYPFAAPFGLKRLRMQQVRLSHGPAVAVMQQAHG
jgi:hypothetical protein